jgi:hypothetical protein
MEAKDLMIGDWVEFPIGIDKIVDIIYVVGRGLCASFAASATLIPVEIGKLKPIPLTTDILEKNGFERRKDGYDIGIPLLYWDKYCTAICGWNHCDDIIKVFDCRYVHQLQHALRLFGIDKEIEL